MIILKEPTYTGGVVKHKGKDIKEVEYGFGIGFDEFNIILYKLGFNSTNGGNTQLPLGYYPSIRACLQGMLDKSILLTSEHISCLQEIVNKQELFIKSVEKQILLLAKREKREEINSD